MKVYEILNTIAFKTFSLLDNTDYELLLLLKIVENRENKKVKE